MEQAKIDALERLGIGYQAVIELVAELKTLGTTEQRAAELARMIDARKADLGLVTRQLEDARTALGHVQEEATQIASAAQLEAQNLTASASAAAATAAADVAARATEAAERTLSQAQSQAASMVAQARDEEGRIRDAIAALAVQRTALERDIATAADRREALSASLAELEQHLTDTRTRLAPLLGGA
jgi:chromosome segregation ATPase